MSKWYNLKEIVGTIRFYTPSSWPEADKSELEKRLEEEKRRVLELCPERATLRLNDSQAVYVYDILISAIRMDHGLRKRTKGLVGGDHLMEINYEKVLAVATYINTLPQKRQVRS